jgi:hypothetical protein
VSLCGRDATLDNGTVGLPVNHEHDAVGRHATAQLFHLETHALPFCSEALSAITVACQLLPRLQNSVKR